MVRRWIFRPRGTDFATDFVADFLSCVFLLKKTDFVTDFEPCEHGPRRKKGEKYLGWKYPNRKSTIKIHAEQQVKHAAKISGSEKLKGVFWKRGLFRKVHSLQTLENLETLEILKNALTVENKGQSDHFLEILQNQENQEISEIPENLRDSSSEKIPFVMTPFFWTPKNYW